MIDFRRLPVTVRDAPPALVILVAAVVPALHRYATQVGDLPDRPYDVLTVAVLAFECAPLVVRRKWPALGLALVVVGFAVDQLRAYHTVGGWALPLALVSASVHIGHRRRTVMIFLTAAYVPLAIGLDRLGSGEGVVGFVTFYLAMALAWGIGSWVRQTRLAETERRLRVAEATRAAERSRIARELHDVVTHHVTAMVVQAESARYLTAAPGKLEETLTAVTDTGRRAIADLRQLLDLLNPDHGTEPRAPSAGDLPALVEQTRRAGQPVEFSEEGVRAESAGSTELTAFRVVQEALTNALKYDHGGATAVRVRHGERELTVEVTTDGTGSGAASPGGSGRGLAGLRERVEALGGDFSAGRRAGGGFSVAARIPR
ncbi:sensor histidine kinase [Symbioplanes lichenis]|uniref:sensor histidine kinase n=1 Tax=Symbioplanes lichenis TaxID=1629072 RepID=UPI00273A5757|nr:histidine kinase [Actinoplanes lichenis]